MRTRVLTAVVGIPLLVFIATTRSLIPAIVLSFAIDILCVVEMFKEMKGMPIRPPVGLQI